MVLNLMEHAVMYAYFALHEASSLPSWFVGRYITWVQFLQMAFIALLSFVLIGFKLQGGSCSSSYTTLALLGVDGAAVSVLFGNMLRAPARQILKKKSGKKSPTSSPTLSAAAVGAGAGAAMPKDMSAPAVSGGGGRGSAGLRRRDAAVAVTSAPLPASPRREVRA